MRISYTRALAGLALSTAVAFATTAFAAPTGGFLAILNEGSSFGDSPRTIGFYDAADLSGGPLFSVFIGYERPGNFRELSAITSDPATGDVYVLGFDSGVPGFVDDIGTVDTSDDDTNGDYDLYKIDFQSLYSHWETNFKGTDARTSALVDEFSPSPNVPGSATAASMMDYVTYAAPSSDPNFTHAPAHSNAVVLNSAISKIGEVNHNQNSDSTFYQVDLEYIGDGQLLMLDDSNELTSNDNAANDHAFRLINRVSSSPGAATSDNDQGGYNNTTTESWESHRIGLINLDTADGVPVGHSEPQDSAYYLDSATGVRGAWVAEGDGGGDDIAFFEFDAAGTSLGYRPFTTGNTAFALDNDPFTNPASNDGRADKIFVDADTGDLIIIESSFSDAVPTEPGVIRREVVSYDNGSGEIQFGAWGEKVVLNPVKDPASEAGVFFERGYFSAYDSVNDQVYFYEPGSSPDFEMDVYVLDLATGVTTSYLDVDESINLFFGGSNPSLGDKGTFFFLGGTEFDVADFDEDGDVDSNDLATWKASFGVDGGGDTDADGDTDGADFLTWQQHYTGAIAPVGGVPEPGSAVLALASLCGLAFAVRRRR